MQTSLFDFHLPPQLIAQEPLPDRDASRMLALDRATKTWRDGHTRELPAALRAGDLLILNDTRVIPARLRALRDSSGGKVEFLLLPPEGLPPDPTQPTVTRRVLTKAGGRLLIGETFTFINGPKATLRERLREAGDVIEIHCPLAEFHAFIEREGEIPLPPYVRREAGPSSAFDRQRYQTIFASTPGAVAAPTAGLHFSESLLDAVRAKGVETARLTLHVGPGTFKPVKVENVDEHFVDPEPFIIPLETLLALRRAKREGRRVIAVGTTSLRALEGAAAPVVLAAEEPTEALIGKTDLFVHPPYEFKIASGLLTNFHIPKSSLLMLICAFAAPGSIDGIEFIQKAYEHAVASGYRFYSYGDACLIQ